MVHILQQVRSAGAFFIIIGLIACIIAFVGYINANNELKQKIATSKGIIVSCQVEEFYSGGYRAVDCRPTVDFTTASGEKIEFVSSYSLGVLVFYKGEEVTVSYNPRNPHDALITSLDFWIEHLLTGGAGLLFIGIGVINILIKSA